MTEADEVARAAWAAAQRIGMQIAALPIEQRAAAFAGVERGAHETARQMRLAGRPMDEFIDNQMKAIRGVVQSIDLGGNPQGGNA